MSTPQPAPPAPEPDPIDEASAESFPASDPPAWIPQTVTPTDGPHTNDDSEAES